MVYFIYITYNTIFYNIIRQPLTTCMQQHQKRIEKYQFNLKRLLGQGSYASVYRGKVIETGEPVAVKVIDKRIFTNNFNTKNIQSQIEIMKKVNHKNIVKLYDVFQTSNNMYIVTELCDSDLYGYLKQRKKLSEDEACNFLKQIMKGIKYLNGQNIIHRDLKPANILLKGTQCKISDFGFAKNVQSENTFLKSIVGTPLYMSPQLLLKQTYTNKSDLWSLGLIFYQMLHGKTPWMASNELQLINAIKSQKIAYSKLISDLSKDFISKCLKNNEEQRLSWQEAFQHPLVKQVTERHSISIGKQSRGPKNILENKSAMIIRNHVRQQFRENEIENNSNLINFNQTMFKNDQKKTDPFCLTPKLHKNISEIRLKKVEALTPKSSFANINNKLRQVWALGNTNTLKGQQMKSIQQRSEMMVRKKRNFTMQLDDNRFQM